MFDLGMQELVVIFVVALLVFGPKRLPELARTLGKSVAQLKRAMTDVKDEMDKEFDILEKPGRQLDVPAWKEETTGAPEKAEEPREEERQQPQASAEERQGAEEGSGSGGRREESPSSGEAEKDGEGI
jgi:Tat protein translocase TatB subunit